AQRFLLDDQLAELDDTPRDHGFGAFVPGELLAAPQLVFEGLDPFPLLDGNRETDARLALAVIEVHRHDEFRTRHGFGALEHGSPAGGELVAGCPPRSPPPR